MLHVQLKELNAPEFIGYFAKKWYSHSHTNCTSCYGSALKVSPSVVHSCTYTAMIANISTYNIVIIHEES